MTVLILPPLVAAPGGVITDSLGREWDATKHPRGRDGKFIHTFKMIRAFMSASDTDPWMTGEVTQINDDGSIRVKINKTTDPNLLDPKSGLPYVGNEVDIQPDAVESINEKAKLNLDMFGKPILNGPGDGFNAYDFSDSNLAKFWDRAGLEASDLVTASNAAEAFKTGKGKSFSNRAKYHLALYAKSISGDGREHSDGEYRQMLEELGVDPDIIDDTPDGMSGLQVLAEEVNAERSPNHNKLDSVEWYKEAPPVVQGTIREATHYSNPDVRLGWFDDGSQGFIGPDGTIIKFPEEDTAAFYAAGHNIDPDAPDAPTPPPEPDAIVDSPAPSSKNLDFPQANEVLGVSYPGLDFWTSLDLSAATPEMGAAAYAYSYDNSSINKYARTGEGSELTQTHVEQLDELMQLSHTKHDMQLNRTILGSDGDEHIDQLFMAKIGDVLNDKGFTGTTHKPYDSGMPYGNNSADYRIHMKINVPAGTPAVDLQQASLRLAKKFAANNHEGEIILDRDSNFEVVDVAQSSDPDTDFEITVNLLPKSQASNELVDEIAIPDEVDATPETDAPAVSEPDPDTDDYTQLVDDQGPYRVNAKGEKLRIGDRVLGADGKELEIVKFENNNKGVVAKDAQGKKYARHRNKLEKVSAPEPVEEPVVHEDDDQTPPYPDSGYGEQPLAPWEKELLEEDAKEVETPEAPPSAATPTPEVIDYHDSQALQSVIQKLRSEPAEQELTEGYGLESSISSTGDKLIELFAPDSDHIGTWNLDLTHDDDYLASEIQYDILTHKNTPDSEENDGQIVEFKEPEFNSAAEGEKLRNEIPHTLGKVMVIFNKGGHQQGVTDVEFVAQVKQYRNSGYALSDALKSDPGTPAWNKAVTKAIYNASQGGVPGQDLKKKIEAWRDKSLGVKTDAPETPDAPPIAPQGNPAPTSLPLGYENLAPGDKIIAVHPDSALYAATTSKGNVKFFYENGNTWDATAVDTKEFIKQYKNNSDTWKFYDDPNAPVADITSLPDGYMQPPAGHKVVAQYHEKYVDDNTTIYAVESPDGGLSWYYANGNASSTGLDSSWITDHPNEWLPVEPFDAPKFANTEGTKLPDGYPPLPVGAKIFAKSNSSTAPTYAIEHSNGSIWYYYADNTTINASLNGVTRESIAKSENWNPIESESSTKQKSGPSRVGADGKNIYIGDKVKSTTDGKTYTVVKFENNDVGVVVKDETGKKYARNRKKLISLEDDVATESASSSATTTAPKPPPTPIVMTPKPSAEVDKDSPWYGEDKKPVEPPKPKQLSPDLWVPEDWMDRAEALWKSNTTSSSKTFDQTLQYARWNAVAKNGSLNDLNSLKSEGFITDQLYNEALESINQIKAENEQIMAEYQPKLDQYMADMKAWRDANGLDPFAFPGAPKNATESFTGGTPDWTKSHIGTPSGAAVLDAMRVADPDLAARGASITTDGDQIEDLDVRVMRVIDSDGNEKLEMKFKLTAWAGDALASDLAARDYVIKHPNVFYELREKDETTGLPKYTKNHSYSLEGSRITYTDKDTGAQITFMRAAKPKTHMNENAMHNTVQIMMDPKSTPEQYQKTLENFGIKKAAPAAPEDIESYVNNKLIAIAGSYKDPTKNLKYNSYEQNMKLEAIESKYGITVNDMRMGTDPHGRIKFYLSDEARDKVLKIANIGGAKHNVSLGNSAQAWVDMLTGPLAGLNATNVRWSEGIGGNGMSSSADMNSGGADYVFTKMLYGQQTSAIYGTYVAMHPKAVARRLDINANAGDSYGKHSASTVPWEVMKYDPYEVTFKHSVPVQEMWYVNVGDSTLRQQIIQLLKNKGIYEINGIPVEDFVLNSGMDVPTIDESLFSSNHLPPALEKLLSQL